MEMYAAYYPPGYDLPISTLFWGAVIFVAVVAAWILVGNAIKRQRNRRSDGRAVEEGHREDPGLSIRWQIYGTRPTSFH